MKKLLMACFIGVMSMAPAMADPIAGVWKTEPDEGAYAHVKIGQCGAVMCGVVVKSFKDGKEFKSKAQGKQVLRDLKPAGDGKYTGKVWRPSNNKVYSGKVDLVGNTMKLRGCVLGGLACGKQTWTRIQ